MRTADNGHADSGQTAIGQRLFLDQVRHHRQKLLLRMNVELLVDVIDVRFRGALGDAKLLLDVGSVVALGKKEENLRFAPRKKMLVGDLLALRAESIRAIAAALVAFLNFVRGARA